jgi:hypothetical protein
MFESALWLQKSRGKWSAVDSIASFGWSGSAFLGGVMVDNAGFDTCFLITALAQCVGWAVTPPPPLPESFDLRSSC